MAKPKAINSAADWLKQHARAEAGFAKDLAAYFASQSQQLANDLADLDSPTLGDVASLFDAGDEHDELMEIAAPHARKLVLAGAVDGLAAFDVRKGKKKKRKGFGFIPNATPLALGIKQFDFETEDDLPGTLPDRIVAEIRTFLQELEGQPYWRDIQSGTQATLKTIIREGMEDGLSGSAMAKRLREALGGAAAKVRAASISRTETTGCMNSGHQATLAGLEAEGSIDGKTWLSIIDGDTRETHAKLNNTTIKASAEFDVGGSAAPFPAHWSLPPEERINCRCVVVASFGDALE